MPRSTIRSVIQKHARQIMALPGVVGVAEGESDGEPCIKVYVVQKTEWLTSRIPPKLRGYRVVVQETGDLRALGP